jgi:hypothetical protein
LTAPICIEEEDDVCGKLGADEPEGKLPPEAGRESVAA